MASIAQFHGSYIGTCGYCRRVDEQTKKWIRKKESYRVGFYGYNISAEIYEHLINRGWRRSGVWFYQNDNSKCCCPQYAIRLECKNLKLTKSQKKVVRKMEKFVKENKKKLVLKLVPSEFNSEEFKIYKKYQIAIHKDQPNEVTKEGYTRFLCRSPLKQEKSGQLTLGSFHLQYLFDNQIVAVSVIDILPCGVSSVYHFYDPDFGKLSFGVYSVIREAQLVVEWSEKSKNPNEFKYYHLGYYIHTCPKMKYKGNYSPSELLCSVTYEWVPIEQCIPKLEQKKFVQFSDKKPDEEKEDCSVKVLYNRSVFRFEDLQAFVDIPADLIDKVKLFKETVGHEVVPKLLFYIDDDDLFGE